MPNLFIDFPLALHWHKKKSRLVSGCIHMVGGGRGTELSFKAVQSSPTILYSLVIEIFLDNYFPCDSTEYARLVLICNSYSSPSSPAPHYMKKGSKKENTHKRSNARVK